MAGTVLVSLPVIVVFFSFQKYFTKGVTLGAVRGQNIGSAKGG